MANQKRKNSRPRARPKTASRDLVRNDELEAAIVDAPLDPLPRLVYGDWLQAAGEPRGDWVTLSAGIEADPKNLRLRSAAVDFLDTHRGELLGKAAALLPGAWIGWRGGFVDEIRLQPTSKTSVLERVTALFEHPSCRFVRHVALGRLPQLQAIIDAIALAAPPLLESFVAVDWFDPDAIKTLDLSSVARLGSVRRLSTTVSAWPGSWPELVELYLVRRSTREHGWRPRDTPALEELTLDCERLALAPDEAVQVVRALPALRRLRLLHLGNSADDVVAALTPFANRLELLDCSHSQLSDAGAARLLTWPRTSRLVALRTAIAPAMTAQLQQRLSDVAVSNPAGQTIYGLEDDSNGVSWISHRAVTGGRDGLRLVPGAGHMLYLLGTNHSVSGREAIGLPMLEASLTMPCERLATKPWANAALAHSRLLAFDDAELIAREGILRAPQEPNFFAIALYALRRGGRLAEAVALVPRAAAASGSSEHNTGAGPACLCSCLVTLAQAGRHAEVLALADEHVASLDPNMHAVISMTQVALGDHAAAAAAFERAGKLSNVLRHVVEPARRAVFDHAAAVLELASRRPSTARAVAAIKRAKKARYHEWHWIAVDPNLRTLEYHSHFRALISTGDVKVPPTPRANLMR